MDVDFEKKILELQEKFSNGNANVDKKTLLSVVTEIYILIWKIDKEIKKILFQKNVVEERYTKLKWLIVGAFVSFVFNLLFFLIQKLVW